MVVCHDGRVGEAERHGGAGDILMIKSTEFADWLTVAPKRLWHIK